MKRLWDRSVVLTRTDTTVGFVSKNADKLDLIKKRPSNKRYITVVDSLSTLQCLTRVSKKHAKTVRRACKTTFIYPNGRSYRLVCDARHRLLLERLGGYAYSTSANRSGEAYDETFAKEAADVIVAPLHPVGTASRIVKLGKTKKAKIR